MGSLITKFFAGGLAGFIGWAICEPSKPALDSPEFGIWSGRMVLAVGIMIGLAVGGLEGYTRGGKVHLGRGLGMGLVFGAVGSTLGFTIGGGIASAVFGAQIFDSSHPLVMQILARTVCFIPMGLFLGAAIGGSSLTIARTVQGAIGGAIGAAIGGAAFDLIGSILAPAQLQLQGVTHGEVGGPSRAIAFTILGAAIGLFIGLVERLARSAWIRLSLGRNEGREWSIDGPQTFIGRNESATIPLFGDMNVAPIHASIHRQGRQYTISDGGSPIGTYVNGQRIQQAILMPGATIQIGSFVLQFLVKGAGAPVLTPDMARGAYGGAQPVGGAPYQGAPQPGASYAGAPSPTTPAPGFGNLYSGGAPTQMPTQMPAQHPGGGSQPTVAYTPAAAPTRSLFAVDGPLTGQRFPLVAPLEVGREAMGLRLTGDPNASRRHALLTPGPMGVQVQDLGSTNGTYVNGQRIAGPTAMNLGDVVKIGSTSFRIE